MAADVEQNLQADVTGWGIAALVCTGLAVLAANVSGLIPPSALSTLHVARNDGVSVEQLRQQVVELRTATAQLHRQNEILTTRFSLQEQSGSDVVRRVGALEVAMPSAQELRPFASAVDRSVTTASIGETPGQQFAAEGGSVVVRQSPLPADPTQQPLPAPILTASVSASGIDVGYGLAIGASFGAGQGNGQWQDLEVRLGSMLIDFKPLVTDEANSDKQRLVVGPVGQMSEARDFCQRIEQMEIACTPTIYSGTPLSN